MKRKKRQDVKIYGFPFPQQLLEDIRNYQIKHDVTFPASAYAALICVLKQIHEEGTQLGEVQDFNLAKYSKKLDIAYSTLYTGLKFLERHGFVYDAFNRAGNSVYVLHNYVKYQGQKAENRNYFNVPHSLFETNIMAELVRTSNARVFELMFSLLTQFRHGVAKVSELGKVEEIVYPRTMSTLKKELGKRSKGVRDAITLLEPLFNIRYVGLTFRKEQKWIKKIEFTLKPNTVVENTDAFEVNPLVNELQGTTESLFDEIGLSYKSRDLKDIMVSLKHEVIDVLKYVTKDDDEFKDFSERDSYIQSFYYSSLRYFRNHLDKLQRQKVTFHFSKSIGAYFRTIFRNSIIPFIKEHIPGHLIKEANMKEFMATGKTPLVMDKFIAHTKRAFSPIAN